MNRTDIVHLIVFGAVLMPAWLFAFRRHCDKRYVRAPKAEKKGRPW